MVDTLLVFAAILNLVCVVYGFWLLDSLSRTNRIMRAEAERLKGFADKLEALERARRPDEG